ncbi:MAG: tetratricopeptide repeat protein, partial [Planctomycetota bacterium]
YPSHYSSWSVYGGCGSFGWSLSLWYPWWHYRSSYWNACYADSWYYTWSRPYSPAASYWWYPSTTYCPVYLTVPSSVVVVERSSDDRSSDERSGDERSSDERATSEPTAEPADAAPASGETIVAGGSVAGSIRTPDLPAGGAAGAPADDLAKKYVELGDFYFKAGRFLEAADTYGRARTYAPNDASVHFVLADAAFANGDYHFAAFLIGEAVRLDPAIASAETDKRTFYGDAKAFDEQMEGLDHYLDAKPYDAQAHLVRGYNLRFSGRSAAAMHAFRRVLEITPDNRAALAFLAVLAPKGVEEPSIR